MQSACERGQDIINGFPPQPYIPKPSLTFNDTSPHKYKYRQTSNSTAYINVRHHADRRSNRHHPIPVCLSYRQTTLNAPIRTLSHHYQHPLYPFCCHILTLLITSWPSICQVGCHMFRAS